MAVLLLGLIRWKVYIYADGVVEPENREVLHARHARLSSLKSTRAPGQRLNKGDVIMVCQDAELDTQDHAIEIPIEGAQIARMKASVVDQGAAKHHLRADRNAQRATG